MSTISRFKLRENGQGFRNIPGHFLSCVYSWYTKKTADSANEKQLLLFRVEDPQTALFKCCLDRRFSYENSELNVRNVFLAECLF